METSLHWRFQGIDVCMSLFVSCLAFFAVIRAFYVDENSFFSWLLYACIITQKKLVQNQLVMVQLLHNRNR